MDSGDGFVWAVEGEIWERGLNCVLNCMDVLAFSLSVRLNEISAEMGMCEK